MWGHRGQEGPLEADAVSDGVRTAAVVMISLSLAELSTAGGWSTYTVPCIHSLWHVLLLGVRMLCMMCQIPAVEMTMLLESCEPFKSHHLSLFLVPPWLKKM